MLFYVDWQFVFYTVSIIFIQTLRSNLAQWPYSLSCFGSGNLHQQAWTGIFPWPFGCVPPAAEEGQRALAYTHSLVQFLGSFINRTTALWLGWKKKKTFSWLRSNKNLWFYSEENNKLFWTHLASSCAADGNKSEWSFSWKWNNICFWNRYYCILYVDFV